MTEPQHNVCTETILPDQICTDCTGQPFVETIPPHVATRPILGWTAGANSVEQLSDGVRATWTVPLYTAGEIAGIAPAPHRLDVRQPETIRYGVYVFTINGVTRAQALILGLPVGEQITVVANAEVEIIRANGFVIFTVNTAEIHRAQAFDDDLVLLADCTYASGDSALAYAIDAYSTPITDLNGEGLGSVDVTGRASDVLNTMYGEVGVIGFAEAPSFGLGDIIVDGHASDFTDYAYGEVGVTGHGTSLTAPDVAIMGADVIVTMSSASYVEIDDSPDPMDVLVDGIASEFDEYSYGEVGVVGTAYDVLPPINVGFLFLHTPGYFALDVGHGVMTFEVHGNVVASSSMSLAMRLFSRVVAKATMRSRGESFMALTVNAEVRAAINWLLQVICEDTLVAADTLDQTRHALAVASDVLIATDVISTVYQGRVALAAFAILADSLTATGYMQLTDEVVADAVLSTEAKRIAELISTANVADSLSSNRMDVLVVFEDEGVLTATETIHLDAMMHLDVAAFVGGRFTFDGIPWTIYSIAPAGAQVNEIEGWDYDSFFELDGQVYATSPRGIVRLEGNTDEGEDIDASLDIALSNFGSSLEKMVPAVQLGIKSDGAMAIGVRTYEKKSRQQKINWYALSNIERASPTGVRLTPSKGLHSVYMGFQIKNLEGAGFELDFVKIYELALKRRKTS